MNVELKQMRDEYDAARAAVDAENEKLEEHVAEHQEATKPLQQKLALLRTKMIFAEARETIHKKKDSRYETLTAWEDDGEIPEWEDLTLCTTYRDYLRSLTDRYTRMLDECQNDERIRYQLKQSQPLRVDVPEESGD